MDMKMIYKSLPPLVEGKIQGYLKLVIDEIVWIKKYLGEISVFLSWWGETDKVQFRPIDITKNVVRSQQETTKIYAIRTNISLFEEYIKNCESIQLVIVDEETNTVVGISQITDLLDIFKNKSYFRYVPVINNSGNKIGELHVSMKLEYATRALNTQLKTCKYDNKQSITSTLPVISNIKHQIDVTNDKYTTCRKLKSEENEIYKSVLKSRSTEFQEPVNRFNNEVTDKLVAQVVARAQRLRGALLKETCNEDVFTFNDNLISNNLQSYDATENQARLSEYFLDEDMTSSDENKTLYSFRSMSSTSRLIDDTSNNLKTCKCDNKIRTLSNMSPTQINTSVDEISRKKPCTSSKDIATIKQIVYIRIFVKSFTLSSAGYRRVKSCSLSHDDSNFLSATYFVQYDMTFDYIRKIGKMWVNDNRPIKISSKKKTKQVIHFNHDSIYGILILKPSTEYIIKFKLFVRHLSKKSLIELGTATVYINDIMKNENWIIAQPLVIVNKGIKIGELNLIIELDVDSSHFAQHIGFLQTREVLSKDNNKGGKKVSENQTKTGSQKSSTSTKKIDRSTNIDDSFTTKNVLHHKAENIDDNRIDVKDQDNSIGNKVLLQGLIYVAEGKDLPELNTYLICRAFWREDQIKSQVCYNTTTPFYHFCQLVPLIYGTDLLERIKDNYVIIEVYYRNNNIDTLLGLAKLPVHQFYIAYRDSRVLSHLLLSKYPVIGVDGWVPIMDPVTGQSYGQLLALVALGTAEQITLLETSKGLRNITTNQQTVVSRNPFDCTQYSQHQSLYDPKQPQSSGETILQSNFLENNADNTIKKLYSPNLKTQECQTNISTVKEFKFNKKLQEEISNPEYSLLHNATDQSSQVVNGSKAIIDQAAQTETDLEEKQRIDVEEQTCINELYFNNDSDDGDNNSIRHNFHLPTNTYRSVGVGAEYNEESDQQLNTAQSNTTFNLPSEIHIENESTDSLCNQTTFRAIVEIECALHLPKVEKANETIEPSTYVSFQANTSDPLKHSNSYMITNVFAHSCNPKWNWKCDTKLSTELLLHDEKRLILKVWRIFDPDISMQINLEKDMVIGFSAIDLSILINGFPTVSGWFHIMDFTGKCNGQIKVSITPLDNLVLLGKPISLSTTRLPICTIPQSSELSPCNYEMHYANIEENETNYSTSVSAQEEDKSVHSESQLNNRVTQMGLEDMSMSFLSLSLKQKLTELDEITRRLESRLRDVTNTAFEDDFENEFDINEPTSDNENNDFKTANRIAPIPSVNNNDMTRQIPRSEKNLLHNTNTIDIENQNMSSEIEIQNHLPETYTTYDRTVNYEVMKPNFSKASCFCRKQNLPNNNHCVQHQNDHLVQSLKTSDNILSDCPERGTKTDINYLLDKLSLQLPMQSYASNVIPTKKNTTNSTTNTQQNNKNINFQDNNRCDQKVHTESTQTNNVSEQDIKHSEGQMENGISVKEDVEYSSKEPPEVLTQPQTTNKMSTVIREELITEESSNISRCDELTTYLVTSNIRHMDLNNILNPLLYQHLVPDLHYLNPSSEEEIVEQLDNRYSKAFNASLSSRLNKVQSLMQINVSPENTDLFRITSSGLSENMNDSIDLTVLHKSSYNDLLANTSTDSTTTITTEKSLIKLIDVEATENNYSTSSETSVLSRQAPDGGNPVEDVMKPLTVQQTNEIQDSSSSSI
nr:PREDICTED: C2 domain-containing protein 3 isoform X1 [Megachile rotundata]